MPLKRDSNLVESSSRQHSSDCPPQVLTQSRWRLPARLHLSSLKSILSYHADSKRGHKIHGYTLLQLVILKQLIR